MGSVGPSATRGGPGSTGEHKVSNGEAEPTVQEET